MNVLNACRYGQARKRGRMLVPKLDYLQYIAVKGVITYLFGQISSAWSRLRSTTSSAAKDKLESAGLKQESLKAAGRKLQGDKDSESDDESPKAEPSELGSNLAWRTKMAEGPAKRGE